MRKWNLKFGIDEYLLFNRSPEVFDEITAKDFEDFFILKYGDGFRIGNGASYKNRHKSIHGTFRLQLDIEEIKDHYVLFRLRNGNALDRYIPLVLAGFAIVSLLISWGNKILFPVLYLLLAVAGAYFFYKKVRKLRASLISEFGFRSLSEQELAILKFGKLPDDSPLKQYLEQKNRP